MSLFSSISKLIGIDSGDIEAANNGGLTSQSAGTLTYFIDMNKYDTLSIEYVISGTGPSTLTVEFSNDKVASGSATFVDATTMFYGSASYTASAFLGNKIPICATWVKIKVVIGGVASDNAVLLVARKKR